MYLGTCAAKTTLYYSRKVSELEKGTMSDGVREATE
jgi:hypothetical protein